MKRALFIATCLVAVSSSAAAITPDAREVDRQLWTELAARVTIVKHLDLDLEQITRLDQDFGRISKSAQQSKLSYEIWRPLEVHVGYRLSADRRDEGDWRTEHRPFVGARLSRDLGEFEFGYRLQFEVEVYRKADKGFHDQRLRNRVDVAYEDLDPFQPFATFEVFTDLGSTGQSVSTGWRYWRATGGIQLDVGDSRFELYYRLRQTFVAPIDTDHIIGVGYRFDLGKK